MVYLVNGVQDSVQDESLIRAAPPLTPLAIIVIHTDNRSIFCPIAASGGLRGSGKSSKCSPKPIIVLDNLQQHENCITRTDDHPDCW